MFAFTVEKQLQNARLTTLTTPHGEIKGPFFQFVATRAAIRGAVFQEDLDEMGVQIVLANTYHLHLQPGEDTVAAAGGLHGLMQWNKPITTDSGGYQVFSLGKNVSIDDDGVTFQSHLDGRSLRFTPEVVMEIQKKLGADIIMPLDVATAFHATREEVQEAMRRTYDWAKRCQTAHEGNKAQALYGIVQGGVYPDLREEAAKQMGELDFFGYSIGGELQENGQKAIREVVQHVTDFLPPEKPRYLMGYGAPEDIVEAVRAGVDQFDCVLPIRNARHGQVFKNLNSEYLFECLKNDDGPVDPKKLYDKVDMTKADMKGNEEVFSPNHPVIQRPYTNGYVQHLLRAEPQSGARLTVLHNILFYKNVMQEIRQIINDEGK